MAPSKIRKALGAVKDKTSIGLAKVSSSSSLSDLDVAIVKATRHDEFPADEKHIREILSLTCYSRAHISACVNTLCRRLNKTKNWTVALKTLILIQRLLCEGDPAYEQEIFFATRRGTRMLNMSDFRDTSRSNYWDYSAFVRTYALYLDERLEYRMQGRRGKRSSFTVMEEDIVQEDQEGSQQKTPVCKATPTRELRTEQLFSKMQHLQQLLERFLACRPTGGARDNRIVFMALYPVVKDSIHIYYDITEITAIFVDRFMELDTPQCIKIHEIFSRLSKQFEELDSFYAWGKQIGLARSSEYPEIDKITQKKLDVMDEFIREKTALAKGKRPKSIEPAEPETEAKPKKTEDEPNPNDIKALPAPPTEEGPKEEPEVKAEPDSELEPEPKKEIKKQDEGDLLNLGEDAVTSDQHANQLALALFDNGPQSSTGPSTDQGPTWEAFPQDGSDWESALVHSATNMSTPPKTSLPGGFDMLMLDGMYQHGTVAAAGGAQVATGSASSMALGSFGRPAPMLALPAPPTAGGASMVGGDPFAASAGVAPPPYVQMSEMEKKQRLLVEEQMMWQQYAMDGRQGHINVANGNYPYNTNNKPINNFGRTY